MDHKKVANQVRRKVLKMIYDAQASHIGSNLSCIDLLTVLYENINLDSDLLPNRDRVIFSKGWAAATAYVFLERKGLVSKEELDSFGTGKLLGLVEKGARGVEASTGSMGHGLPIGAGMALGAKRSNEKWKTYILMSDGEMDCGTTWESALIAAHHGLSNLVVIIDYNKLQAMGATNEILGIEPLRAKWASFGWEVREVNGHDHKKIEQCLTYPPLYRSKPLVIIADTIKGKGVSFMENKVEWHYKNISKEEYKLACEELSSNNLASLPKKTPK